MEQYEIVEQVTHHQARDGRAVTARERAGALLEELESLLASLPAERVYGRRHHVMWCRRRLEGKCSCQEAYRIWLELRGNRDSLLARKALYVN